MIELKIICGKNFVMPCVDGKKIYVKTAIKVFLLVCFCFRLFAVGPTSVAGENFGLFICFSGEQTSSELVEAARELAQLLEGKEIPQNNIGGGHCDLCVQAYSAFSLDLEHNIKAIKQTLPKRIPYREIAVNGKISGPPLGMRAPPYF